MSTKQLSPRLVQLQKLLEKAPKDAFLLYAAALEFKKLEMFPEALEHLARTLEIDADYLYAYYQQGQILEQMEGDENVAAAKLAYEAGMKHAKAKGDQKALSELTGARHGLD